MWVKNSISNSALIRFAISASKGMVILGLVKTDIEIKYLRHHWLFTYFSSRELACRSFKYEIIFLVS